MQLSPRELVVLKKLAEGLTVKEVAAQLYVAPSTVITHKKKIYTKTQTRTLVQLGAIAVRNGIIAIVLCLVISAVSIVELKGQQYPDLTEDIAPSHGFATIANTEASFNNARRQEEIQLGLETNSLGDLVLPAEEVWNGFDEDQKVLFLINAERFARTQIEEEEQALKSAFFLPPICFVAGMARLLDDISQDFAEELLTREEINHTSNDGRTPEQRIADGFGPLVTFIGENLFAFATFNVDDLLFLAELMIYVLIYEDLIADSKHRQIILTYCTEVMGHFKQNSIQYIDDHNESGNEGYMGLGVAYGPLFGFPHGAMVVMDFMDPHDDASIAVSQDSDLINPSPCPDHLEVNGDIDMSNDGSFETSGDFITDANIASDAVFEVTANAGHQFDEGFELATGSVLTVQKGNCQE